MPLVNSPIADLHMHTYYSDGQPSPQSLLDEVLKKGLKIIAITDHDGVDGNKEAQSLIESQSLPLELIPAIEFTTSWDGIDKSLDVLGYFLDFDNPVFQTTLKNARIDLQERMQAVCDLLTADGFPLTYAEAEVQNPRFVGGVAIIDALIEKGYAPDFRGAFHLFIKCARDVRGVNLKIQDAITAIHSAGGVAVLAHPARIRSGKPNLDFDEVKQLADWGLDGIEIYHHSNSPDERQHYLDIAQRLDLLVTGGSDEHNIPAGFTRLATEPVTAEMVEGLREKSQLYR